MQSANGELSEWERDFALSYVTQSGPLKGLGVTWKNAAYRSEVVSGVDQNRLILSYSISL
ncbi:Porin-like protein NicP precursor [compost metagenome]